MPGRKSRLRARTEDPVNRAIRRVGYALTAVILVLVAQLTYLQVIDASNLANDPNNIRKYLRDVNRARGEILTADDQIVAQSLPTGGELKFQRVYPQGDLFSDISGYQSFVVGNTGVEASYNNVLTGRDRQFDFSQIVLRQGEHRQRRPLADTRRAADGARRARRPEGVRGRARHQDRRSAGDVLEPDVRPEPARGPRHGEGEPRRTSCSTPTRRNPRSRARTASGIHRGRRSRS